MPDFLSSFDFSKPLSLYIHVPFCDRKCSYCAFFSVAGYHDDMQARYISKLMDELSAVVERMDGLPFETVYIGGGNPGCLGLGGLLHVARLVCRNGRPKEFTIEMNPDSLAMDMDELFGSFATRISLGVQSLDERALSFLGRNSSIGQTFAGLELSQRLSQNVGCELSYDLMTCLGPWHDPLSDVSRLCRDFPTNHLSVYALTLEEGTAMYKAGTSLPDEDSQVGVLEDVWAFLEGEGFEHYEVSNFAKDGRRGLHNCRYWDYRPYLGLGPGAASTAFKDGVVARFDAAKSVYGYVTGDRFANVYGEVLTRDEALEEFVLMGMRYKGGLDLQRLKGEFPCIVDPCELCSVLDALPGYEVVDSHLVPTDEGLLVADYAARSLLDILL